MKVVKGFKATDIHGKCRGHQFVVGETYEVKGEVRLCGNGFHFCLNLFDVYNYYDRSADTRLFEIEAIDPVTEGDKSCTGKIKIVRELTDRERLEAWIKRTNSGDYNSGDYNSGHYNSGDYNSGHYNSGDYNSGHRNSGFFNTQTPFVRLFNKTTKLRWDDPIIVKLMYLPVKPILQWIPLSLMTDQQKKDHPSSATTEGFLENTGRMDWSKLTTNDFDFIRSLPNFDAEVFLSISGLDLRKKGG